MVQRPRKKISLSVSASLVGAGLCLQPALGMILIGSWADATPGSSVSPDSPGFVAGTSMRRIRAPQPLSLDALSALLASVHGLRCWVSPSPAQ